MQIGDERLPERFWSKVSVNEETGCWLWTGCINKTGGYARFNWPTRNDSEYAHRVVWKALVGPIPEGFTIDHVRERGCIHRHCVNPAHLEPVTQRENNLRGDTTAAAHAAKTHCPQGHPYAGDNLYLWRNKRGTLMRYCNACRARHSRARVSARARDAA